MDSVLRIEPRIQSVFRNSPLERGASSTLFESLEEAGCVVRGYAVKLDKMLKLVTFDTLACTFFYISKVNPSLFSCITGKIVVF